jgi:hypothetical protein
MFTTTTRSIMATEVHTYNGNKTYDAEFTNWFNNWFTEIEEEMDWECNISYVSDQQKEEIFLAYQDGLTDNKKLLRTEKEDEIVQEIDLKLWDTRQEFHIRLEEFREKNNFSNLGDAIEDLFFEALFKNDEGKIEEIAKMQEKLKQASILDGEDEEACSYQKQNGEDIELINEPVKEIEEDYIDEWFKKHNFTVKDLLKITSFATKKLNKILQ